MKAAGWTLAVALLALAAFIVSGLRLPPDLGFYITAARQLAEGAELYRDIGDVNPPPVYYWHALAHRLSVISGLDDITAFHLLFFLYAGAIFLWISKMTGRLEPGLLLYGFPAFAVFCALYPAFGDFGQREHVVLLGFLPHLVASGLMAGGLAPGRAQRLAAAALAGAVCLVRPPYLIIPYLAVEIALIWLARSPRSLWRRENFAAGGAFLGLGLALHLLHPAYLSSVVPDALAYYTALGNQDLSQLWTSKGVLIPCLAPFALLFFIKQRSAADALRFVLASAALGFALVFLLHGKGWAYQLMPIIALGAFAALVGIFAPNPRLVLWVVTAPLPAWLLFVAWQASQSMARPDPLVVDISELLKVPGRPAVVYGLAPESYPLFSAIVLADARWSAGDPHLWRLDGYYRGLEPAPDKGSFVAPEKAKAEELAIRQDLIERFLASEADFLVVSQPDAPSILGGTGFDYLEYLMTDLAFAERFARFHEVGQLGQYRFYARHTSP